LDDLLLKSFIRNLGQDLINMKDPILLDKTLWRSVSKKCKDFLIKFDYKKKIEMINDCFLMVTVIYETIKNKKSE
jgi:hypothetical protein